MLGVVTSSFVFISSGLRSLVSIYHHVKRQKFAGLANWCDYLPQRTDCNELQRTATEHSCGPLRSVAVRCGYSKCDNGLQRTATEHNGLGLGLSVWVRCSPLRSVAVNSHSPGQHLRECLKAHPRTPPPPPEYRPKSYK